MIDQIYIIISTEFEKERYGYLNNFFQNSPITVTYFEAIYRNRDEHKLLKNKYSDVLLPGQKCVVQSHVELLKFITDNPNNMNKRFLILESDVVFGENFWELLNNTMEEAELIPENNYIIFPENGCDQRPRKNTRCTPTFYKINETRCAAAMILPFSTAKIILEDLNERFITGPIDHILNDTFKDKNITSYWVEPPILLQGSMNGTYKSWMLT